MGSGKEDRGWAAWFWEHRVTCLLSFPFVFMFLVIIPFDRTLVPLAQYVWGQLVLTTEVLLAPATELAMEAWDALLVPRVVFTACILSIGTLLAVGKVAMLWETQWSQYWFNKGASWQRTFGEQFASGPLAHALLFATVSVSTVLFEPFCMLLFGVARGFSLPGVGAVLSTAQAVVTYAAALEFWWAARTGLILPHQERRLRVASAVLYFFVSAAWFAYEPSRETSTGKRLVFLEFLRLVVANPLPSLVLGFLAVVPSYKLAKLMHERIQNTTYRIFAIYLVNCFFMLATSTAGARLGDHIYEQAAHTGALGPRILWPVRILILGAFFVFAYLFARSFDMLMKKSAIFMSDWGMSLTGFIPTMARQTSASSSASLSSVEPVEFQPIWRTVSIPHIPRLFYALRDCFTDLGYVMFPRNERATMMSRAIGVIRVVLANSKGIFPLYRALCATKAEQLKTAFTEFDVVCAPIVGNPSDRDLVLEDLTIQVREWKGTMMGTVRVPSILRSVEPVFEVQLQDFRVTAHSAAQPREMKLRVRVHNSLLVRAMQVLMRYTPTLEGWLGRVRHAFMASSVREATASFINMMEADTPMDVQRQLDVVVMLRAGVSSISIPIIQYKDGRWGGDALSGWDRSGVLEWLMDQIELQRRGLMETAIANAALRGSLETDVHRIFSAIAKVESRYVEKRRAVDDIETSRLLALQMGLDCFSEIYHGVWDMYDKEKDAFVARAAAAARAMFSQQATAGTDEASETKSDAGTGPGPEEQDTATATEAGVDDGGPADAAAGGVGASVGLTEPATRQAPSLDLRLEDWKEWLKQLPRRHRVSLLVLWEMSYRAADAVALRIVTPPSALTTMEARRVAMPRHDPREDDARVPRADFERLGAELRDGLESVLRPVERSASGAGESKGEDAEAPAQEWTSARVVYTLARLAAGAATLYYLDAEAVREMD